MLRLAELRKQHGYTQADFAKKIKFSQSTVAMWETGAREPGNDTLKEIAQMFDVSVDYLIGNSQIKNQTAAAGDELNDRDRRDIKHDLEKIMSDLDQQGTLMFDGDPATPEARESIRSAIAVGLEMAKKMNKQTYTPKKYRKSEDDK